MFAYRALRITLMATKNKHIRNLPSYFKGMFLQLVDETYFSDLFMLFNRPVELQHPKTVE